MARYLRSYAVVLAALSLVVFAFLPLAVSAAKPEQWAEPVNESFIVTDVCAFSYTQTIEGTVKGTTFFDEAGNPSREVVRFNFDGTFEANGVVVPFIVRGADHVTYNADGSVVVISTGIVGRVTIPGEGLVGASIGRIRLTFGPDPGPPLSVEILAGQNNDDEFFGGILCDLLTP